MRSYLVLLLAFFTILFISPSLAEVEVHQDQTELIFSDDDIDTEHEGGEIDEDQEEFRIWVDIETEGASSTTYEADIILTYQTEDDEFRNEKLRPGTGVSEAYGLNDYSDPLGKPNDIDESENAILYLDFEPYDDINNCDNCGTELAYQGQIWEETGEEEYEEEEEGAEEIREPYIEFALNNCFGTDIRGIGLTDEPALSPINDDDNVEEMMEPGRLVWTYSAGCTANPINYIWETEPGTVVSPNSIDSNAGVDHFTTEYIERENVDVIQNQYKYEEYDPFNQDGDKQPKNYDCDGPYSCNVGFNDDDGYWWDLKGEVLVKEDEFWLCDEASTGREATAKGQDFKCEDGEWEQIDGCQAGHVGRETFRNSDGELNDRIVGYYEEGGECQFDRWYDWDYAQSDSSDGISLDNPTVFNCRYENGDVSAVDSDFSDSDCMSANQWAVDEDEYEYQQWIEAEEMPHVEFGAYQSYFEYLLDNETPENQNTIQTDFVDPQDGWTTQTQGLLEAERKYSDLEQDVWNPEWWEQLNMTDLGFESTGNGYYNFTTAEGHYREQEDEHLGRESPWLSANAGNRSDHVNDDSPNFAGGFAGNCDDQTWTYEEILETEIEGQPDWSCGGEQQRSTGSTTWSPSGNGNGNGNGGEPVPVIPIPDFNTVVHMPGTTPETPGDGTGQEREIGVVLFGFENIPEEDRPSHIPDEVSHYSQVSEGSGDLTHAEVRCWTGTLEDKPLTGEDNFDQDSDRAFAERQEIETGPDGEGQPNTISQTVKTQDKTGYACEWAYETTDDIGEDGDGLARGKAEDVIALHQNQHQNKWGQISEKFDINDNEFPQN